MLWTISNIPSRSDIPLWLRVGRPAVGGPGSSGFSRRKRSRGSRRWFRP